MFRDSQPRQELIDKENEKIEWVWSNKRFCSVRGIISGFLFGCVSLALVSIVVGFIAPKSPESVNIKAPDDSEFTNPMTYNSMTSEALTKFNYGSTSITSPTTKRSLSKNNSIESISKLNPELPNPNFSSILKINQKIQNSPLQPKISNENMDKSVKIEN